VGEIAASLRSLDGNVFLITGKPAKGYKGTRRTFHPELASKIAKWERSGAEPAPQEIALWDERLYGQGYKPHHSGIEAQRSGVSPAPPIEVPIVNTYITPRSAGNSRIDRELHVPQTREQLEAELSYLEDAQRDLTNPYEAQRARFRYVKVRDELRHLRN
jgi:hypothetical protein